MPARRFVSALTLAMFLTTTGAGAGTTFADEDATAATAAAPADGREDATTRFRREMKLPAQAALFAQLAADPGANREWSVPLTDAEAAEVGRRAALPEQATAALEWAASQESYAGSFIDHEAGGVLVVQFAKADVASEQASVRSRAPGVATLETRSVTASLEDLDAIRERLKADRAWFASIGAELISTGDDARANALVVGVLGYSPEVDASVRARFGEHVIVREDDYSVSDACTVNSCWPQKGGILIFPTANSAIKCTSGFIVRYGSPVQYGLLTAGHCVKAGGTGNWAHSSTKIIGKPTPHTYKANVRADAVVIKMSSAAPPTSTLNYYLWEDDNVRAINRVAPLAEQVVGSPVCMQGWGTRDLNPATNGRQCGTITGSSVDRPSCLDAAKTNCVDMLDLYEVSYDTHPGDSGGPVTAGCCTAMGLVTDSYKDSLNKSRSWYSSIVWAMSELDAVTGGVRWRVCLNATCTSYY